MQVQAPASAPKALANDKSPASQPPSSGRIQVIQGTRFLILAALITINALAIQGSFGGINFYAANIGLVIADSMLSYYETPNRKGKEDLRKYKWVFIIVNIGLTLTFNSLGLAKVGGFASAKVGLAQLISTLVTTSTLGSFLYLKAQHSPKGAKSS